VLTLMLGASASQGITIIATIILARIFRPEDFGILAIFIAISSFLRPLVTWRFETAIMLPESDADASNVQILCALVLFGMCGLSLALILPLKVPIVWLMSDPRLGEWLFMLPVSLLVSGLYQILSYWCIRKRRFRGLTVLQVVQSAAIFGFQLALLATGLGGPGALILGLIAGQAVGAMLLLAYVLNSDAAFFGRSFAWRQVKESLFLYKNFPKYSVAYAFIGTSGKQAIIIILRLLSEMRVVGQFSLALRAVSVPVVVVTSPMRQVFLEKAATELKDGGLESFVLTLLKWMTALGTPLLVFFIFYSKTLFRTFLGTAWENAGPIAACLAVLSFTQFVAGWLDRVFDIKGEQKLALYWEICRTILAPGTLALALLWSHDAVFSVAAYVGVDFLCMTAWILLAFKVAGFAIKNLTVQDPSF